LGCADLIWLLIKLALAAIKSSLISLFIFYIANQAFKSECQALVDSVVNVNLPEWLTEALGLGIMRMSIGHTDLTT
jgi:hypothetical protein